MEGNTVGVEQTRREIDDLIFHSRNASQFLWIDRDMYLASGLLVKIFFWQRLYLATGLCVKNVCLIGVKNNKFVFLQFLTTAKDWCLRCIFCFTAIVGDITPSDGVPKEEKSRREREALNEMCEVLGGGLRGIYCTL